MLCPLLRMTIGREYAVSSLPPSPQEDWKRYSPLLLCISSALYCMLNRIFFWTFFWWSQVMVFQRVFFLFWTFMWRIFRGLRRWQSYFKRKLLIEKSPEKNPNYLEQKCAFSFFIHFYHLMTLQIYLVTPFWGLDPSLWEPRRDTAGTVLCILFSSIALSLWIILFFLSISPCLCLRCLT